jgi:hypothetical protein
MSTCEIVLVVALVLVLGMWYYSAVYRPSCRASMSGASGASMSGASGSYPSPVGHEVVHEMPPMRASAAYASVDESGLRTGSELIVDGAQVSEAAANTKVGSLDGALTQFHEAPEGVEPTMWPAGAEASHADVSRGAEAVSARYKSSVNTNHALEAAVRTTTDRGTKALSKTIGKQGGVTLDLMQELVGGERAEPLIDCTKFNYSLRNIPSGHPCLEAVTQQLAEEDMARSAHGSASAYAYRTMGQR